MRKYYRVSRSANLLCSYDKLMCVYSFSPLSTYPIVKSRRVCVCSFLLQFTCMTYVLFIKTHAHMEDVFSRWRKRTAFIRIHRDVFLVHQRKVLSVWKFFISVRIYTLIWLWTHLCASGWKGVFVIWHFTAKMKQHNQNQTKTEMLICESLCLCVRVRAF